MIGTLIWLQKETLKNNKIANILLIYRIFLIVFSGKPWQRARSCRHHTIGESSEAVYRDWKPIPLSPVSDFHHFILVQCMAYVMNSLIPGNRTSLTPQCCGFLFRSPNSFYVQCKLVDMNYYKHRKSAKRYGVTQSNTAGFQSDRGRFTKLDQNQYFFAFLKKA